MKDGTLSVEKRTNPRVKVNLQVKYRMVECVEEFPSLEEWRKIEKNGTVLDISLGGVHLAINRPVPVGSLLRIYICIPNLTNGLSLVGEVVWSNRESAGLCFLMVKSDDLLILRNFLEEIQVKFI